MNREEILEIAKPILFNTDMVRAILDGRKTVTRRKIDIINNSDVDVDGTLLNYQNNYGDFIDPVQLSRYKKGDYLYVRETWQRLYELDGNEQRLDDTGKYYYAATDNLPFGVYIDSHGKSHSNIPWRPSIHMPKEATRIFLRVTDVRVERLQNISNKEAKLEGVSVATDNSGMMHRFAFSNLWDSTISKKDLDKYGWAANPWVWVIEFEIVEV